ncbi:MAG: ParB/RepB/Spo0J family partition protein [Rikenellaceae bacterium]|nr:ParB/RepB/Spo0J family partition protein [Rikenellaceae bacterium]
MNAKNKGLGRGLGAIFEIESRNAPASTSKSLTREIAIDEIHPNPKQPRTRFDEAALDELADSIRTLGVIQPVTVKKEQDGTFTIISGERRWRASKLAGLETVPAYIREVDDQTLHEMALVENIQREDLNPMEVSLSLQRLIDECGLTQESLSERVGKKRSTIANYMRLLKLPVEVQSALREDYITMGHAKAIAGAPQQKQPGILRKTLKKGLSVRQTEELVRRLTEGGRTKPADEDQEYPESYGRLVEQLEKYFSQDISIKKNRGGGGKIVIGFADDSDIETYVKRFLKG